MSSLVDRLRGVLLPKTGPPSLDSAPGAQSECHTAGPPLPAREQEESASPDETLGGHWHESVGQRYLVIDRTYRPGHRHGHVPLADVLPPDEGAWPQLRLLESTLSLRGRLIFFDLETTGLAGGAGTYAFLVGCGWFDGGVFRVRQFFLSSFGAERALLHGLAELIATGGALVTYNGKTFDVPLIDTRFVIHRMPTPFAALPHLDMLHCARRLWRGDEREGAPAQSCRLSAIEQALCGHVREDDVPGFEIPSRYFHYVRTGDPRPIAAVLEHNRQDLLSLAWITARAARLLADGPTGATTAREAFGLGRLYERATMYPDARVCYVKAAEDHDPVVRAQALRACAVLLRRERRYEDAAAAWRRLLDVPRCPASFTREATEALAVHHEHRVRDLSEARRFALQALQLESTAVRQHAVQHRLARLERKLGAPAPVSIELF